MTPNISSSVTVAPPMTPEQKFEHEQAMEVIYAREEARAQTPEALELKGILRNSSNLLEALDGINAMDARNGRTVVSD